ncbi:MAG: phage integrase SAM-like domain-containing protein [Solirubrobacteraceae bacterium]
MRIRAYGERHWVPLGTEREGWNDLRAADHRDEIAAMIRRGAWRPPNVFELDPREQNPGFHEFASDWLKRDRRTVDASTADTAEYMLSHHLLPFLHTYRLGEIDYGVLSAYVAHKLERNGEVEAAREAGVTVRDGRGRPRRPLSSRTINTTLDLTARILKDAVKLGLLQSNPASDRELRLKFEGDAAKRELPRGRRANGAHRRRRRNRRAGLEGDARARRTDAANAPE